MPEHVPTILDYLNPQNLTVIGLLTGFIVAPSQKWVVFGYQIGDKQREVEKLEARIAKLEERIDDWKGVALRTHAVNKDIVRELLAVTQRDVA